MAYRKDRDAQAADHVRQLQREAEMLTRELAARPVYLVNPASDVAQPWRVGHAHCYADAAGVLLSVDQTPPAGSLMSPEALRLAEPDWAKLLRLAGCPRLWPDVTVPYVRRQVRLVTHGTTLIAYASQWEIYRDPTLGVSILIQLPLGRLAPGTDQPTVIGDLARALAAVPGLHVTQEGNAAARFLRVDAAYEERAH